MTDEESKANEVKNAVIRSCRHEPIRIESSGAIVCNQCGCRFAVMLLPTIAQFMPIDFDDEEQS